MILSRSAIAAGLLLGLPALAQEGANVMVPTVGMFGIDTCGAFLCGSPATVPNGSKRAVHALEAAFRPRLAPPVARAAQGRIPQGGPGDFAPPPKPVSVPRPGSGRAVPAVSGETPAKGQP